PIYAMPMLKAGYNASKAHCGQSGYQNHRDYLSNI
ncbi:unnamed protein product, partial [marine sediment metagenome]